MHPGLRRAPKQNVNSRSAIRSRAWSVPRTRRGALAVALLLVGACRQPDLLEAFGWERPERGMVVAEHPLAVEAGLRVLRDGGNAADAAVATALALAVVYPQAGNLGGGGFALCVSHVGAVSALDFREVAPITAESARYLDFDGELVPERAKSGPLAVAVPGTPAGLQALLDQEGSGIFNLRRLAQSAIDLAEEGFEVDPWLAKALRAEPARTRLMKSPAARRRFYPGGEPLRVGQKLKQPELARTLRRFARHGVTGFYRGETARAIVRELRRAAGHDPGEVVPAQGWVDFVDLERYEVRWREPLRGWFRGKEIVTMPPPSSGGLVVLEVLALLDGLPLETEAARLETTPAGALGLGSDELLWSDAVLHGWIEALRTAFADRAVHMGDPDFHRVPMAELLDPVRLAAERASFGGRARPDVQAWAATPEPEGTETTHISVVDSQGDVVSLTTTLNSSFGSGLLVEDGGFLLNNQIDDFAVQPDAPNQFGLVGSDANALEPTKRPLSSMTPIVVRHGGQGNALVMGSPGGPRIITAQIGVLLRTLVFGQDPRAAVLAPRVHQQWRPARTELEAGWDPRLIERLEARGHEIVVKPVRWASVQLIALDERGGPPVGLSDPRRGGVAGLEGEDLPKPALPAPEQADPMAAEVR